MKHRTLSILGLTAAMTVGGVAGVALGVPDLVSAQQDPTSSTEAPAATTDPNAPVDVQGQRPDRGAWLQETLAPLVADGTIDQAQADAVIAAIEADRPPMGPGGHHGHGMRGRGLDAAAEALGVTADELRTELQDGKTLGQVADERGVDRQALVDAMVADLQEHLAEEVAAGEHTQEEADQKLADATARITESLDQQAPAGGPGGRGGHRHGPMGEDQPADAPTTEDTTG